METRRSTRQRKSTLKVVNYGLSDDEAEEAVESATPATPRKRKSQEDRDGDFDAPGEDDEDAAADGDAVSSDLSVSDGEPDEAEAGTPRGRGGHGRRRTTGGSTAPRSKTKSKRGKEPSSSMSAGCPQTQATLTGEFKPLTKRRTQAVYRATARGPTTKRKGTPETDGELWRYLADNINKSMRVYVGPLQRHDRYGLLLILMYGPDSAAMRIADGLRVHFSNFVLPDRGVGKPQCAVRSPWLPPGFETDQQRLFRDWYRRIQEDPSTKQKTEAVPRNLQTKYIPVSPEGDLITFLGPHDAQRQEIVGQGQTIALTETWEPVDENVADAPPSAGWLFDVGGIPLAIGWAPRADADADQILAIAVVPNSDYAYYATEQDLPKDDMKAGSIQLWRLESEMDGSCIRRPSRHPPRRASALCFDWGRPTRMQWCPVPPASEVGNICGLLAVLCDGRVHVLEAREPEKGDKTGLELIQKPIATFNPAEEELGVTATCFAWIGINRIALGCKDGSVSTWSVYPPMLLQRQMAHHVELLEVCSGYPSQPYLVASVALGGCPTVTDFTDPAMQTSAQTAPSANLQHNMLCWSEHMRGFVSNYASSTPGFTAVAFLGARFPSQPRTIFQGFSQPVCLATGAVHPYTLVGCADGTLWSFNTMHKVFYMRNEKLYKMKLFQHEFRQVKEEGGGDGDQQPPKIRGAVRFLSGFKPEVNDNPRNEYSRNMMKMVREKTKVKEARQEKRKNGAAKTGTGTVQLVDRTDQDDYPEDHNPIKGIILQEPETRVVAVAWNPNLDVGWWAAVALGSGLVRVMDLGLEKA